jgi:hypothetical protein
MSRAGSLQARSLRFPLLSSTHFLRISALAVFAGASTFSLHAQQAVSADAATSEAKPAPQLVAATNKPALDLASTIASLSYSSSSDSTPNTPIDSVEAERLNLATGVGTGLQPPPRRRYGRPRYNDSSHNPDGSNKYAVVLGVGMTAPLGNTYHYLNTNYGLQVGAGRNFNKNFTVMVQFDYDRFGFTGATLYNQQSLYNYYCNATLAAEGVCTQVSGLDGTSHVWSFTVDPSYSVPLSDNVSAYGVVGVGFYHKTANFTVPATGEYCDYYYGCYQYEANETIDKYTSNAPGFNGGIGLTFKPSRFANERLFVEGRYVFVDNSQRSGITVNSGGTVLNAYNGNNFYPANSNRTTYTVYKAGIRF